MRFQEILHVFSDDRRQFFDLEEDHIEENGRPHLFGLLNCGKLKRTMNRRRRFTEAPYNGPSNVVGRLCQTPHVIAQLTAAPEHGNGSR